MAIEPKAAWVNQPYQGEVEPPPEDPLEEIGRTGLSHWYGQVQERYLTTLQGTAGIKVLNEMARRDPSIVSVLSANKLFARTTELSVEAGGETDADKRAAEFLEQNLEDMSHTMSDAVDDGLSMLWAGWAWEEICYKRREGPDGEHASLYDDGMIGWRKWAPRKQTSFSRWEFDEAGGVAGLWQLPLDDRTAREIFLPIGKSLHYTTDNDSGDPEGRSICEGMYETYYFLKHVLPMMGIGFERSFVGLPVFHYRPDAVPASGDEAAVKKMGQALRVGSKAFAAVPASMELMLMSAENNVAGDLLAAIRYHRELMLQTAMAEFISIGSGNVGSLALHGDKSLLFMMGVNGILDRLVEVWDRFAVPRLFSYNEFGPLTALPKIVHSEVRKENLPEMGEFLDRLSGGVASNIITIGDEDEKWIRTQANMPDMPEEGEEREKPTPPPSPFGQPQTGEADEGEGELAELAAPPAPTEPPTDIGSMLQATTSVLNERQESMIQQMMGGVRLPPDSYWDEEELILRAALLPEIEAQVITGAEAAADWLQQNITIGSRWDIINTDATRWARAHTGDLVKGITKTSKDALGEQVAAWIEAGEDLPSLIQRLEPIYGPKRAELIATTEVTQAYAEGNLIAWEDSGVVEGSEWRTVADELVCPICGPLSGKQAKLGAMFPGGLHSPPSHPRCRCWLVPVVMRG